MKRKIGMLALALVLAAGLTSCGNGTTEASPKPSADPGVTRRIGDNAQTNNGTSAGQTAPTDPGIYGRVYRGGDAWMGDDAWRDDDTWMGNDAVDNAYDVIRGAVDGARDDIRGYLDGMDNGVTHQNTIR